MVSAYPLEEIATPANGSAVPTLSPKTQLESSLGVRAFGMGQAMTGRPDDLSSLFYNPAGLSLMGYWEYGISHHDLSDDVDSNSLMMTAPLPYGNLGAQFSYYSVQNNLIVENRELAHPDRNKYGYSAGLSYGAPVYRKNVHAGITLKYFSSIYSANRTDASTYPAAERGFFADIGFTGRYDLADLKGIFFFLPEVSAGLAIRNMHPRFGMPDEVQGYAPTVVTGIAAHYSYLSTLSIDVVTRDGYQTLYRYGFEFWPVHFMALRVGYEHSVPTDNAKALTWGFGLGESIGQSKMSFEYAGMRDMPESWGGQGEQYFHRIAVHQSFGKILEYTDRYGKARRIPLAISERYNNPLRYATILEPHELVTDVIQVTKEEEADPEIIEIEEEAEDTEPDTPVTPDTPDEDPVVPVEKPEKKPVAIYPFRVEFVSSRPTDTEIHKEIRRVIVRFAHEAESLDPMKEMRYKLTPWQEQNEDYIKYLNRICRFHSVDLLVFHTLKIDEVEEQLTLRAVYFKKGDSDISGETETSLSINRLEELKSAAKRDFALQTASLLDLELSEDVGPASPELP